jgi:phenylpropionate dioxygenase-like ring-hydroxylating dioxygenase large terminal subunit
MLLGLALTRQAMEYRYRILRQRYLGQPQAQAYRHLTNRLSSLVLLRNKIRAFLAFSQDRTSTLVDVLQEVIQELLQRDRYLQQEITWIAQCTNIANCARLCCLLQLKNIVYAQFGINRFWFIVLSTTSAANSKEV